MLNSLEERILKYLIQINSDQGVSIIFEDVPVSDAIQAVKSLARKGFVMDACTMLNASAILKQEGKYYFEQKEQRMFGGYYDKIKQIENYISILENLKKTNDKDGISKTVREVLNVYSTEIPKSTQGSICFALNVLPENAAMSNFYDEVDVLIGCLNKIMSDTKIESSRQHMPQVVNNISQNQSQAQSQSIEITLNQVIKEIENVGLSPEETLNLIKLIREFDDECKKKEKSSRWERAKKIFQYLIDKSIEVGIAVLPFIAAKLA